MIVGKVVGSVVSTRKSEKLIGSKFMIIEPVHHMKGDLITGYYTAEWCGRCRRSRIPYLYEAYRQG